MIKQDILQLNYELVYQNNIKGLNLLKYLLTIAVSSFSWISDLIIYLILLSQCKTDTPLSMIGLNILDSSTKYTT